MFEPHQGFPSPAHLIGSRDIVPGQGRNNNRDRIDIPRGQEIPYSPKRHLGPAEIEQIVAGYLAGTTARELGERFEVDRKTVSGTLKSNNVTMRLHPMQPAEIEHAIRLYESGLSLTKVAEQISYDSSTIWREFKRMNLTMRDCQGKIRPG